MPLLLIEVIEVVEPEVTSRNVPVNVFKVPADPVNEPLTMENAIIAIDLDQNNYTFQLQFL